LTMRTGWQRLARLSCGELVSLPVLWILSLFGALAIRHLSVVHLSRLFSALGRLSPLGGSSARSYDLADLAARLTPGEGRCLARSLLLMGLLQGSRRLNIGVRLEGGELSSHAWVELAGRAVGESPDVIDQFVPLLDRRMT
jgi:hypothetical protein